MSGDTLRESGLPPDHPAIVKAAEWLIDRQIFGPGDWQVSNPAGQPGGWAFEFRNDFYPDVDDTAFVLIALLRSSLPDRVRLANAVHCGIQWMVSMQNDDGGWGAFDRNNDLARLSQVPFADHNAMIDPSTADVTARVVECLATFGWSPSHPVVARALEFLFREQTPEGAWYGRWGVNYIYGTSGVLRALAAVGLGSSPAALRAMGWLRRHQNIDGGFGESCASYADSDWQGRGESIASQTAWGLVGLLATSAPADPAVGRAAQWLVEHQRSHGGWDETSASGTGFPRVFYLKYQLYRHSFPLDALSRYYSRIGSTTC